MLDRLVEQGLGETRLVGLVMAPSAIAVHVDHDVAAEFLAEIHRQVDDLRDRFGVLAVDVEDGALQHLGHVAGVRGRTALFGRGGEPDLVINDDVQRPARRVSVEAAQIQRFLHDSLAGKGRVSMDEQDQTLPPVGIARPVLLGPHPAQGHGIDVLQMTRIETERQVNSAVLLGLPIAAEAQVVRQVSRAVACFGPGVVEFREDLLRTLADDVRQHVQPPPMGHTHHDLGDALTRRLGDRQIQEGNQALRALQ